MIAVPQFLIPITRSAYAQGIKNSNIYM